MAYFENISKSYEEAAAIDGCHPIRTFWEIVFPMAQGGLVTVTILILLIYGTSISYH